MRSIRRAAAGPLVVATALTACASRDAASVPELTTPSAFRVATDTWAISSPDAQIVFAQPSYGMPIHVVELRAYDLRSGAPAWHRDVDDCAGTTSISLTDVPGRHLYVLSCHAEGGSSSGIPPGTVAMAVLDEHGNEIVRRQIMTPASGPEMIRHDFKTTAIGNAFGIVTDESVVLYDLTRLERIGAVSGSLHEASREGLTFSGGPEIVRVDDAGKMVFTGVSNGDTASIVPWSQEIDGYQPFGIIPTFARFDERGFPEWKVRLGTEISDVAYDPSARLTYVIQSSTEGEPGPQPVTCLDPHGRILATFLAPKNPRGNSALMSFADQAVVTDGIRTWTLTPEGLAGERDLRSVAATPALSIDAVLPELDAFTMTGPDGDDRIVEILPVGRSARPRVIDVP